MAWIASVSRDQSMPIDQVHVALYGYFPQIAPGDARPYVWRLVAPDRILLASRLRPSAPGAREIVAPRGATLDFRVTWKRVRNVGGSYTCKDGSRRSRQKHAVEITGHDELKQRLVAFAAPRGGDVRYVRIEGQRLYRPGKTGVALPICDAIGKVYVHDPEAFDELLCGGGPGTGKAYGLGLWCLPEIMEVVHAAA